MTDPSALLAQRVGPAMAPAASAPPGASDAIGAPGASQVTPDMVQLAQLVQRLMVQQKGTAYASKMLRRLSVMIKGAMNGQFMQNPSAESDLADAMKKVNSAADKLEKGAGSMPTAPLQSVVSDLMQPPGGNASAPGAQNPQPGMVAYPLAS